MATAGLRTDDPRAGGTGRTGRTGRSRWSPPAVTAPLAVAGGVLAATAYLAAVNPNQAGHYPTCPFLALTGLYCPGCGTLRAVHALAHGQFSEAVSFNPLMLALLPLVVALWLAWLTRSLTGRYRWVAPAWSIWVLFSVVVGFGVLRNLPWFQVLAP